jgi:LPS-assembly lipoprotein
LSCRARSSTSWSDGPTRALALCFLLIAPLALGGCGFRPLYGDHGAASVVNDLSGIDVSAPDNQVGRELKFNLLDRFSESGDVPANPAYRIVLSPTFYTQNVAIQQNAEVTRANFVLVVPFRLIETAHNKVVFHSTSRSRSSYNRVESEFANLVASDDAEKRTAEAVADDIKLQLSVYFDRQASRDAPATVK